MNVFTPGVYKILDDNGEIKGYYPAFAVNESSGQVLFHTENLGLMTTEKRGLVGAQLEARAAAAAYCDMLNNSIKHGIEISKFIPTA